MGILIFEEPARVRFDQPFVAEKTIVAIGAFATYKPQQKLAYFFVVFQSVTDFLMCHADLSGISRLGPAWFQELCIGLHQVVKALLTLHFV